MKITFVEAIICENCERDYLRVTFDNGLNTGHICVQKKSIANIPIVERIVRDFEEAIDDIVRERGV